MMIGTWMASQGVPDSTGGIGWMKGSIGSRSSSAVASAAIAAALKISIRLRSRSETTPNSATPQPRKSIDSYMFEAGMRPAICQRWAIDQVTTRKPPTMPARAIHERPKRSRSIVSPAAIAAGSRKSQARRDGRVAS